MIPGTLAALSLFAQLQAPASPAALDDPPSPPRVEVVFVLDTTGSMSGLIEGAKQKIWSIANHIADGDPVPDVRFGLVAYRDVTDEYVTRRVDLTDDLDHVFAELMKFEAAGGGDGPEHVNAALHDAVYAFDWTRDDDRVLRLVFLVGDAPPHTDYDDGKDYPSICEEAVRRGLIINTIRCGGDAACAEHWKDIARRSEGVFTSIGQSGGVTTVATPFDDRLAELNAELAGTNLGWGSRARVQLAEEKVSTVSALPAAAAADRAEFAMKKEGRVGSVEDDLLSAVRDGAVALESLKDEALPDPLKGLGSEERQAKLDELAAKREEIVKQIEEQSVKRQEFLREAATKAGVDHKNSFDAQVLQMLKKQAADKGIEY